MLTIHTPRLGFRLFATVMALLLLLLPLSLSVFAVPRRDVDYSEDFTNEKYAVGTQIDKKSLPLYDFWSIQQFANYQVAPCSVMKKDGDTLALHFQGYSGMLSTSAMFEDYTYSVTMRVPKGVNGGIAVTARHSTGSAIGPLYEADMFVEDGGNPSYDIDGFRHDYSGIAVYPTTTTDHTGKTKVVVGIKTFEDNGKHRVANRYYETFVDADLSKYFTVSFVDKDEVLTIKINGNLLCTVEMSNPGTFKDPVDKAEYYRTAVVKDETGDTVLELDNAKLAVKARVAITNRASQCYIAGMTAFSHNPENGTLPPETTPDPDTEPGTNESTDVTETTENPKDQTAGGITISTDLVLLIVFGAAQVILVVAIALLVFGKKKE